MAIYLTDETVNAGGLYCGSASTSGVPAVSRVTITTKNQGWSHNGDNYYAVRVDGTTGSGTLFLRKLSNGVFLCGNYITADAPYSCKRFDCVKNITIGGGSYSFGELSINTSNSDAQNILNKLSASDRKSIFSTQYIDCLNISTITGSGSNNGVSLLNNNIASYNVSNGSVTKGWKRDTWGAGFLFFIAKPATPAPVIDIENSTIGVITSPKGIKVRCEQTCTAAILVDDAQLGTFQVTANQSVEVPLDTVWDSISKNVAHTLKIKSTLNGIVCEDKRTFIKRENGLLVTGKPATVEKRPVACVLLSKTVHATGEDATMQVCNNGNDSQPDWEDYTGQEHYFENESKTAGSWAVNWRYMVDASAASGSTKPGIVGKVGMGVTYAQGD